MSEDEIKDSIIQDVSVGITFIVVGIVLLFIPDYFRNETVTSVLAYVLIFIGLVGVGTELNKLNGNTPKFGLDNFAIGIAFIFGWIWFYSSFDNLLVNILSLLVLIFGVYGTTLGTIQFGYGILRAKGGKNLATKITLTLINVVTGLAVLYEALQKFGIIDSLAK